jgi:hypothetical protein
MLDRQRVQTCTISTAKPAQFARGSNHVYPVDTLKTSVGYDKKMRVYVASSWRNKAKQQATVQALRAANHVVYDFRHPAPGDTGFAWSSCSPDPEALKDPRLFRDEILLHPLCQRGFDLDMGALRAADATVLVLPCGRSAHLELGFAAGAGQKTIVLLDDPMSNPELMYMACSKICVSISEVVTALGASTG